MIYKKKKMKIIDIRLKLVIHVSQSGSHPLQEYEGLISSSWLDCGSKLNIFIL